MKEADDGLQSHGDMPQLLDVLAARLSSIGADIEELDDGMIINGGILSCGMVDSRGDQRIALSLAIAGVVADHQVSNRNADCAAVSFPGFWEALAELAYAETPKS